MVLYDKAQPNTSVQTLSGPEVISGTEGTFFRGSSGTPSKTHMGGWNGRSCRVVLFQYLVPINITCITYMCSQTRMTVVLDLTEF